MEKNKHWSKVTFEDVLKAIEAFDNSSEHYPKAKNTFLIYNKQLYPAKHIRGIAYSIANNEEIKKTEYSGGLETVKFFENLGFQMKYK